MWHFVFNNKFSHSSVHRRPQLAVDRLDLHVAGLGRVDERCECVVQIHGGTIGTFQKGYLEQQRVQRHLYIVEWVNHAAVASFPGANVHVVGTHTSPVTFGNTVVQRGPRYKSVALWNGSVAKVLDV